MIYEVDWYPELCCEECNETIHNHFHCPSCNEKYAGTSIYGAAEKDEEFECEECGHHYVYRGYNDNWEIEIEEIVNDDSA